MVKLVKQWRKLFCCGVQIAKTTIDTHQVKVFSGRSVIGLKMVEDLELFQTPTVETGLWAYAETSLWAYAETSSWGYAETGSWAFAETGLWAYAETSLWA